MTQILQSRSRNPPKSFVISLSFLPPRQTHLRLRLRLRPGRRRHLPCHSYLHLFRCRRLPNPRLKSLRCANTFARGSTTSRNTSSTDPRFRVHARVGTHGGQRRTSRFGRTPWSVHSANEGAESFATCGVRTDRHRCYSIFGTQRCCFFDHETPPPLDPSTQRGDVCN